MYNPWQDSWESLDCIFDWDGYGPDAFYTRAGNLFYTVEGSKDRKIIVRAYDWTTGGKYCVTTDFEYFSKCDVTFALSSDNLLALSPWLTEGSIEVSLKFFFLLPVNVLVPFLDQLKIMVYEHSVNINPISIHSQTGNLITR